MDAGLIHWLSSTSEACKNHPTHGCITVATERRSEHVLLHFSPEGNVPAAATVAMQYAPASQKKFGGRAGKATSEKEKKKLCRPMRTCVGPVRRPSMQSAG